MKCWGLVPARGGSKSIERKNLVRLAGRPLLDYGVLAAQSSRRFERLFCSTDDPKIAERALQLGIEVSRRRAEFATDDAKVDNVAQQFLESFEVGTLPDAIALIQPTSPFLLPEHITALLDLLAEEACASVHNITPVPHNLHAWNQRTSDATGRATFLFARERRSARNKQEKPKLYAFGNLIAARTDVLLKGKGFYCEPSITTIVDAPYNFDLDTAADVQLAETLLRSGLIDLRHIPPPRRKHLRRTKRRS